MRTLQRPVGNLIDRVVADPDVTRFASQPRAVAVRTHAGIAIFGELLLDHNRFGFLVAALQVRHHSFEDVLPNGAAAALGQVSERYLFLARSIQDQVLDLICEHLPGRFDVELEVFRERAQHREIETVAPVPSLDGAGSEAQIRMSDDPLRIKKVDRPQAIASRAGAHRVVERKQARLQLRERVPADRAGESRRKEVFLAAVHFHGKGSPIGVAQRGLERFGKALLHFGAYLEPVDDYVDRVLYVAREFRRRVELMDFAVDAHPRKTLGPQFFKQVLLLAFPARHDRRDDHQARVLGQGQRVVDHLRYRLRLQRQVVVGAVGRADARKQETQVIVDLGNRADGRTRVVAGRFLLDRDRGREALDQVDIRFFHQLEELACVGRQRFDVAPLTFRIQRVERERRFTRAGQARDHHETVPRQVEADVLEVVGARPADADCVCGIGAVRAGCACRSH